MSAALPVSAAQVLRFLAELAPGWSDEIERRVCVPSIVFHESTYSRSHDRYYTSDPHIEMEEIVGRAFQSSARVVGPLPRFGVCAYDTSSSRYLVLADGSRGVLLRERLYALHSLPHRTRWAEIVPSLELAIAHAEQTGAVTLCDLRAIGAP